MAELPVDVLQQIGITNYVVPFMLVFAISFGILMKSKIISDRGDINGLVAFAIGFLFAILGGGDIVNKMIPVMITFLMVVFIAIMLFLFLGAKESDFIKFIKNPGVALILIGFVVLITFVVLGDYLIWLDKIPAWMVNSSGDLIVDRNYQGPIPSNLSVNESKPHSIIVEGQEYELINGIYYKGGYTGTVFAIASPEVIGAIVILVILAIGTMIITWPQK